MHPRCARVRCGWFLITSGLRVSLGCGGFDIGQDRLGGAGSLASGAVQVSCAGPAVARAKDDQAPWIEIMYIVPGFHRVPGFDMAGVTTEARAERADGAVSFVYCPRNSPARSKRCQQSLRMPKIILQCAVGRVERVRAPVCKASP